jgi:hypothetical protein
MADYRAVSAVTKFEFELLQSRFQAAPEYFTKGCTARLQTATCNGRRRYTLPVSALRAVSQVIVGRVACARN